jgi:hypothetical protein
VTALRHVARQDMWDAEGGGGAGPDVGGYGAYVLWEPRLLVFVEIVYVDPCIGKRLTSLGTTRPRSVAVQHATLSRWRSAVRIRSGSPLINIIPVRAGCF